MSLQDGLAILFVLGLGTVCIVWSGINWTLSKRRQYWCEGPAYYRVRRVLGQGYLDERYVVERRWAQQPGEHWEYLVKQGSEREAFTCYERCLQRETERQRLRRIPPSDLVLASSAPSKLAPRGALTLEESE